MFYAFSDIYKKTKRNQCRGSFVYLNKERWAKQEKVNRLEVLCEGTMVCLSILQNKLF